jgi:hypothetical protein
MQSFEFPNIPPEINAEINKYLSCLKCGRFVNDTNSYCNGCDVIRERQKKLKLILCESIRDSGVSPLYCKHPHFKDLLRDLKSSAKIKWACVIFWCAGIETDTVYFINFNDIKDRIDIINDMQYEEIYDCLEWYHYHQKRFSCGHTVQFDDNN